MKKFLLFFFVVFGINAHAESKKQLWIYTSIYKDVIVPFKIEFERQHPDIEVQIFQAGSEKIQAKVEAELLAKKVQADAVFSADQFWGSSLDQRGLVLKSNKGLPVSPYAESLMVLVTHKSVPPSERPRSFSDLTLPAYKNKVQMGSPLESGTMFSSVAYLSHLYGWDYFKRLRANNIASNGGNSNVIQKVESGEKKFGVVLLENALAAQKRGSPIEIIYPSEGGIVIPGVHFIFKDSPHRAEAELFTQFVLSKEGQTLIRSGYMYSIRKDIPPPDGAKDFTSASQGKDPWTPTFLKQIIAETNEIKKTFSDIVLE